MAKCVLILGSGPNALQAKGWQNHPFDEIVVVNNAWRVRPDWTELVHPDDFPQDRQPETVGPCQRVVRADSYVRAHDAYGGIAYAGGTMAFTASYWVLATHAPDIIAYLGCDMTYPATGPSHFYGAGRADPLRADPTLQSLEAKSKRLQALAARQGAALVNLSDGESRLTFPRSDLSDLSNARPILPQRAVVAAALSAEKEAGLFVEDGRYWNHFGSAEWAVLKQIDTTWLGAY